MPEVIGGGPSIRANYPLIMAHGYHNASLDVLSESGNGRGIAWNDDGTKLYLIGSEIESHIHSYTLTTAFDITTATFANELNINDQDIRPRGMAWNNDGSKMFMIGQENNSVYSYTVTTAYDITTATFKTEFDVEGQEFDSRGMGWNPDGTKMYVVGAVSDNVHSYALTTAFDLTTATFANSFDVSGQTDRPYGMAWSSDGTRLYVVGRDNDEIYSYTVSTAFDITTAAFASSFDISGEDNDASGVAWNRDGTKMYMLGVDNDVIFSYSY